MHSLKKQLLATLFSISFLGCPSPQNPVCQQTNIKPLVFSKLAEKSDIPIKMIWESKLDRPKMIHGRFQQEARSPQKAVERFFQRHSDSFRLQEDGSDLRLKTTREGKIGTYLRFEQTHQNLPVFNGEVVVHLLAKHDGFEIRDINLSHKILPVPLSGTPGISEEEVRSVAWSSIGGQTTLRVPARIELGFMVFDQIPQLVYRVRLAVKTPLADWELLIDAKTATLLSKENRLHAKENRLLHAVDGQGFVFDPSPIASSGNVSLFHENGETNDALDAARFLVTLPRLSGSGFLEGPFVDAHPENVSERAFSSENTFLFDRSESGFEEVMAYFHIDRVQAERIQGDLGFNDVNNRVQTVLVNSFDGINAFYSPFDKTIIMGTSRIDASEDADVLLHEYGHSIQDNQIPNFGGGDQGAIGEGFSDYWALGNIETLTAKAGRPQVIDSTCLAEWLVVDFFDQTGVLQCLRRSDTQKHFPEARANQVHADGEMWSAALFKARRLLGADIMDTLVLESHFLLTANETFFSSAQAILLADQNLFSGQHNNILRRVFIEQGLSRELTPPANFSETLDSFDVLIKNPRVDGVYFNNLDDSQVISQPGVQAIRLHFAQINTETSPSCFQGTCDNIYLYDRVGNLYQILNGNQTDVNSVVIPGDEVRVRLVSNNSGQDVGYEIDRIDILGEANLCGNGVIEEKEECDTLALSGQVCQTLGFEKGELSCAKDCTFDTIGCESTTPGVCGNGQVEPGEDCDTNNLNSQTCFSQGFDGGVLGCSSDCTFALDQCSTCGNGIKEGSESCDGQDFAEQSCASIGLANGVLGCSPSCTLDTSSCLPAECR